MIRLSKLSDYAVVILCHMAREPLALYSAQSLAAATQLALPTVSKILKALVRVEILSSVRGSHGGYRLAQEAARVTVAEVIEAMDGRIALTECAHGGGGDCGIEQTCPTRSAWRQINDAVRQTLLGITLAQLAGPALSFPLRQTIAQHAEPAHA